MAVSARRAKRSAQRRLLAYYRSIPAGFTRLANISDEQRAALMLGCVQRAAPRLQLVNQVAPTQTEAEALLARIELGQLEDFRFVTSPRRRS